MRAGDRWNFLLKMSTIPSEEIQKRVGKAAAGSATERLSSADVLSLREALLVYKKQGLPRRFGATVKDFLLCGKRFCAVAREKGLDAAGDFDAFSKAPKTKQVLSDRLLKLLNVLFDKKGEPITTTDLTDDAGQDLSGSGIVRESTLNLHEGELDKVKEFLVSLRGETQRLTSAPALDTSTTSGTPPMNSTLVGKSGTDSATNGMDSAGSGWGSLFKHAGLKNSAVVAPKSKGISFWCPMLEEQRGSYHRGSHNMSADCRNQIKIVRGWQQHPVSVEKANDLRKVLPELAGMSTPMPPIPLHEDVFRLYVHLLEEHARRKQDAEKFPACGQNKGYVPPKGAMAAVVSSHPGLDAVANARFAQATSRKVDDQLSDAHVNECVHVIEQYKVFKRAPKPKPLVPLSVRVVIQQSMAPADARVADAYSIVKGVGEHSDRKRAEVKDIMVQIFEHANTVAFERLKRGSAADREKRRTLGIQLAAQERQSSLQRESLALAELRVLSRCLLVGSSAVSTLRASRALPELAEDLVRVQPTLSMSQALTLAKAMMKSKTQPPPTPTRASTPIKVTRPEKRERPKPQQIVIRVANGGWRQANTDNEGSPPKRRARAGKKKCYWCGSTRHLLSDCPAKKQGLPKTKPKKGGQ